ncbi:MAG: hypothetical protein VKL39_18885 [Leptolyngbyaceae bacterium]|nr:hypothetical protein [Leptolyngbyaceae bacterium]
MSKKTYSWKRFWCPRNAQIDLGDRGYLVDPESEWGRHANPELVGLDAIANDEDSRKKQAPQITFKSDKNTV